MSMHLPKLIIYRTFIRLKAVPSIRRLVYSSSDIEYQIVELNMGFRGCSVLDSGGGVYDPVRIFDVHCESIRTILDCPEINCGF